jgi:hypothetical protein
MQSHGFNRGIQGRITRRTLNLGFLEKAVSFNQSSTLNVRTRTLVRCTVRPFYSASSSKNLYGLWNPPPMSCRCAPLALPTAEIVTCNSFKSGDSSSKFGYRNKQAVPVIHSDHPYRRLRCPDTYVVAITRRQMLILASAQPQY